MYYIMYRLLHHQKSSMNGDAIDQNAPLRAVPRVTLPIVLDFGD